MSSIRDTPLASVVVPSHNRARLLKRTLRSILAQQLVDLEVIVVDDGSIDDTAAVAAAAGRRVIVRRNARPAGVSAARNQGIAAARGDWIAFCDDDDLWAPDKLARQLDAADRARLDWAYTGDVNVDDGLRVLSGGPPPDPTEVMALLPRYNPISSGGSNVVVRVSVAETRRRVRSRSAAHRGLGFVDSPRASGSASLGACAVGGLSLPCREYCR